MFLIGLFYSPNFNFVVISIRVSIHQSNGTTR